MRILVAVTSYGTENERHLQRVIANYNSLPYAVDIVVLSDRPKALSPRVEVRVGLPTPDPWSLPFAHKRVLAERIDDYDLFIYSEDDIMITEENITSFLNFCSVLPDNEIAGFLRIEMDEDGIEHYPDVNKNFHWDPQSTRERGKHVFAFFTCEHAACYILTRDQLRRAVATGNFLVEPYQGKYDLACTAATDPYTTCGLTKLICISDLKGSLVWHLSNKYIGTAYDRKRSDFMCQLDALLDVHKGKRSSAQLLNTEMPVPALRWSKDYYEPPRPELLKLISSGAKNILSVGCGWGGMEERLVQNGTPVVSIPLDSVVSTCAETRGVKTTPPDFRSAWAELKGERFDCILISNILHLLPNPELILRECAEFLSERGQLVLVTPNLDFPRLFFGKILNRPGYRALSAVASSRTIPSRKLIRNWFALNGIALTQIINVLPKDAKAFGPFLAVVLSHDFIIVGQKAVKDQGVSR